MSDDLIRQAREMMEGISEGPWKADETKSRLRLTGHYSASRQFVVSAIQKTTDADRTAMQWRTLRFLSWCREGVPALIAELEKRNG